MEVPRKGPRNDPDVQIKNEIELQAGWPLTKSRKVFELDPCLVKHRFGRKWGLILLPYQSNSADEFLGSMMNVRFEAAIKKISKEGRAASYVRYSRETGSNPAY